MVDSNDSAINICLVLEYAYWIYLLFYISQLIYKARSHWAIGVFRVYKRNVTS